MRAFSTVLGLSSILLFGFGASACSSATDGASAGGTLELRVMDESSLPEALATAPGEKAVLVNFWATWCGPCVAEMPILEELHAAWKSKGVLVQTVALDVLLPMGDVKTPEGIEAFARKMGFDLPVIAYTGGDQLLRDKYQLGNSLPMTIVIDADGEIVARRPGAANRGLFERMIKLAFE